MIHSRRFQPLLMGLHHEFGLLLAGFGIAAGLVSFTLGSPRLAIAAPDNTLGMALMSAVVDGTTAPNATLIRGSGAVSVTRLGAGFFDVVFDRDLSNCACTASVGHHGTAAYSKRL